MDEGWGWVIENHMVPGKWILVLVVCQGRGGAEILVMGEGRRGGRGRGKD